MSASFATPFPGVVSGLRSAIGTGAKTTGLTRIVRCMKDDLAQELVFIVCFLAGISGLLMLLTHLEATLDRPSGPRPLNRRARLVSAVVRRARSVAGWSRRIGPRPSDRRRDPRAPEVLAGKELEARVFERG
jgi:hypothetical protein